MANTKNRKLPDPKFKVGELVTVVHGWDPIQRGKVVKANKRGIEIEGARNGETFDAMGQSKRRTHHRLALTDRRGEAEALLSQITGAPPYGRHWTRFTLEQLEAAIEVLGLWPKL